MLYCTKHLIEVQCIKSTVRRADFAGLCRQGKGALPNVFRAEEHMVPSNKIDRTVDARWGAGALSLHITAVSAAVPV